MSAIPAGLVERVRAFVYREAALLDARAYDDWLALFADDGRYWVPLSPDQTDGASQQSIAYEDRMLLAVRIERLKAGAAYSHRGGVSSQHVLQAPQVEAAGDAFVTATPFLYVEARNESRMLLAGTVRHRLRRRGETFEIVEKRVDLVDADAMLPTIFLIP